MRSIVLAAAALTAIVAFLSLGCGGKGQYYHVILDPAFSPADQQAAIDALDAWSAAVPVWFDITIGACAGSHEGEICTHATDHAWFVSQGIPDDTGVDRGSSHTDGGEVWIDAEGVTAEYAQELFGHEFGHAMGLKHTGQGIMVHNCGVEGSSKIPVCIDATQFYSVRGWPVEKACAMLDQAP